MPRVRRYGNIRDCGVFRFPGAVGDDGGVFVILGQFHRIQRFRQGTYLVDFHQDGIRYMAGNALIQEFHIRHEQVVPYQLGIAAHGFSELFPAQPVVFRTAVLNGNDGVFFLEFLIVSRQFLRRSALAV